MRKKILKYPKGHHPIFGPGKGGSIMKSGTPTDASCYLYYQADDGMQNRVVSGPRITDLTTARAESMTKADFLAFQRAEVGHLTEVFIAQIRHAILTQNESGDFVEHRISPAVLSDDWVLRATEFVNQICNCTIEDELEAENKTRISLEMVDKKKGFFDEGWLNVRALAYSLPLVMFTKKNQDCQLQTCLDNIMGAVHKVLEEMFPFCSIAPLGTTQELWEEADRRMAQNFANAGATSDTRLRDALERIRSLKASGASKAEIKAEMERVRAQQKQRKAGLEMDTMMECPVDNDSGAVNTNGRDEITVCQVDKGGNGRDEITVCQVDNGGSADNYPSKYRKGSVWDIIAAYRAEGCWSTTLRGGGYTWWVWNGLLASFALYYLYSFMKPK